MLILKLTIDQLIQNYEFLVVILGWLTGLLKQSKNQKNKIPKCNSPGITTSDKKWQILVGGIFCKLYINL